MAPERVVVAELLRPRGNQGEVLARSQTDIPNRLENLKDAWVRLAQGPDRQVAITNAWPHAGAWVLKFAGVDSISDAELFRGADLWVPLALRASLGDGEFFQSDLVGCHLIDAASERSVGVVRGWEQHGGPPLLQVDVDGRECLVPFLSSLAQVDLAARTIRLQLAEGLLDL